ncbi:MAG: hypothetical protein ACRDUA_01490 [Micromonosporaceae bacterium]
MKSDQRDRFEDRLLAELKQVVAERPAPEPTPARETVAAARGFGWKLKLAAIGAAVAAGVAVAVALPLAPGQQDEPAYAVTVQDDGKVRVEIYELKDAEGLERKLEEAGIPAEVDYLPPGKMCREPRYTSSDSQAVAGPPESGGDPTIMTLDPKALRDGETVVLTTSTYDGLDNGLSAVSVGFGVATGEVKPCEPVDPRNGPDSPPPGDAD